MRERDASVCIGSHEHEAPTNLSVFFSSRDGPNDVVKEALGMLGTDVGPVRIPGVVELNASERKILGEVVDSIRSAKAA